MGRIMYEIRGSGLIEKNGNDTMTVIRKTKLFLVQADWAREAEEKFCNSYGKQFFNRSIENHYAVDEVINENGIGKFYLVQVLGKFDRRYLLIRTDNIKASVNLYHENHKSSGYNRYCVVGEYDGFIF